MTTLRRGFCFLKMVVALGAALLVGPAALGAEYQLAPPPEWVLPRILDSSVQPAQGQAFNGVHYLLVDQQTQLSSAGQVVFHRIAMRAIGGRGVESAAHINAVFDPSFQSFTLHTLNVHRDGRVQDRLRTSRINVLRRETDLEYRVYDGSKTVDAILSDVRPGDIVEYAYSIRGSNPALIGQESGEMAMQWGSSVHHLFRRLLAPVGRSLRFRSYLGDFQPTINTRDGWTEYAWSATDVAPIAPPRNMPKWYTPYPYLAWTSFQDWASIARWAEPMYAAPQALSPHLQAEIDRIAATARTPQQRLTAVLDFVQSQIRYLGVEIGRGSYQPRPPQKVLQDRYGDCKDKVLLAITMLRALGVKVEPALVNSVRRHAIGDALPTPTAFDHVILKAQIDGEDYWLDPTRSPQRGQLDRLAQANFERALVLDGQSQALTNIRITEAAEYRRAVTMDFDVSSGYDQPVSLTITTTYEGVSADSMRGSIRNDNLEELQRKYLNFYLRSYPRMAVVKNFTVEDNEAANRLSVMEHYRIPALLAETTTHSKPVAYLYAPDMKSVLARPDDTVRTAPYALQHPADLKVTVLAALPHDHPIAASQTQVRDPAFEFEQRTSYSNKKLQLDYHYRSLADHVTPTNLQSFIANLEKARGVVGFTLRGQVLKKPPTTLEWVVVGIVLVAILFAIWTLLVAVWVALGTGNSNVADNEKSTQALIASGISLLLIPAIQAVLLTLLVAIGLHLGNKTNSSNVALLAALVAGAGSMFYATYRLWYAIWHKRWLRWALQRTQSQTRFLKLAKRFKLPHQVPPSDA